MSVDRDKRGFAVGALLTAALALSGCSSSLVDLAGANTTSDAVTHPREPDAYLPVHDLPPDRDEAVIPPDQRAKIEKELIAARDRQASAAAGQPAATATPTPTAK
jgi:hypothetical protein